LANPGPARALVTSSAPSILGHEISARTCHAWQDISITVRAYEGHPSDFEAILLGDFREAGICRQGHDGEDIFVDDVVRAYLMTPDGRYDPTLDDVLRHVQGLCPAWVTMRDDVSRLVELYTSGG
jgi:hypothetical protein